MELTRCNKNGHNYERIGDTDQLVCTICDDAQTDEFFALRQLSRKSAIINAWYLIDIIKDIINAYNKVIAMPDLLPSVKESAEKNMLVHLRYFNYLYTFFNITPDELRTGVEAK